MPRDWPHPLDPAPTPRQRRWIRIEFAVLVVLTIAALIISTGVNARRKGRVKRTRPAAVRMLASSGSAYPNCAAARSAGAAPVRRGSPGYSRRLDRDGDGVGCE